MTSLLKGAWRGLGAGAAGTTALNLTTHADMAARGRPGSRVPEQVVSELARRAGTAVPGRGAERDGRRQALGAVAGTATGLVVGGCAGALRAAGVRLPTAVGGPLLGAAAMLATDLPVAALGISDPRRWSRGDWLADAVPHLVYGLTTHAGLVALSRADEDAERRRREATPAPAVSPDGAPGVRRRPTVRHLARAAALGLATGCRSTAGPVAVALSARRGDHGLSGRCAGSAGRTLLPLLAAGELGLDKHPSAPDRTGASGLVPRLALGAVSSGAVARRDGAGAGVPALVGGAAAAVAATAGMRARAALQRRVGSDLPGALLEDAVAAGLARLGTRRDRTP